MTVASTDTRHWLLIYRDGKEIIRWAVSQRALNNRMAERSRSKESALCMSFQPRFIMGKYPSTTNKKTHEDVYNPEMLREVFKTRKAISGNLEYVYLVL